MKKFFLISFLIFSLPSFCVTRKEAQEFLFKSMSLPDKTDYYESFYNDNIEVTFKAKEEMPWGNTIPDKEFLHFVLPLRVNNETLDTSRAIFYNELKERVKDLSMEDAILEINHWCHEHVSYQPSDARTSSPLSTLGQAIGRCGEESTFTVAALRSVGIPARQIYTPRWAHTDDNHAWVEAWANGKWYFIGACEPEPVLNLAWFNQPASRGLLMTTNVTGIYDGPEEILSQNPLSTKINVTDNYAPTSILRVKVVDKAGNPVKDAKVNFCIYNYAEFFPAATKKTDEDGYAFLNAGLGDLIVWASDGLNFGYDIGNPEDFTTDNNCLIVTLDKDSSFSGSFEYDIIPPKQLNNLPYVSEEMRRENESRKSNEDSIRNMYISTFISPEKASAIAKELNIDEKKFSKILTESRGNHEVILDFFTNDDLGKRKYDYLLDFFTALSEKDRRDISREAISDHLNFTVPIEEIVNVENLNEDQKKEIYSKYILNPRIEIEYIRPWRSVLSEGFSEMEKENFRKNPTNLVAWINENIELRDADNPQGLRMSPLAVMSSRKADRLSRNIFFVAVARMAGIPARIDPVTGFVEVFQNNGDWEKINFADSNERKDSENVASLTKGTLKLVYNPEGYITDPCYYTHFSISMINEGIPSQLEFDEQATLSKLSEQPLKLEEGQYVLTTGQRLANGGVLSHSEIFNIKAGETLELPMILRNDPTAISVIGNLNAENIYHDIATDTKKSLLSTTGRGFYILGLLSPNHEPSEHALNDISAVKEKFEKDGRKIMLLFSDENNASRFKRERFGTLPENVVFGIDNNGLSRKEIIESLHLEENASDPIFIVADSFNRIVWVSTGYNIGLGEKILSVLSKVE